MIHEVEGYRRVTHVNNASLLSTLIRVNKNHKGQKFSRLPSVSYHLFGSLRREV
jgi:hypothetical protein